MESGYKPLFNRNYLKVLVVGCLLVIIWLSKLNDETPWQAGKLPETPIYWLEQAGQPTQIHIMLPIQGAISDGELNYQQLRQRIIQHRLATLVPQPQSYQVVSSDDVLKIILPANLTTVSVKEVIQQLRIPVDLPQWQTELGKIKASRYLQQRKPEQQIIAHFRNQLAQQQTHFALDWPQLFDNPRILVFGEDAEDQAHEFAEEFPLHQAKTQTDRTFPTTVSHTELKIPSKPAILLLGQVLAERASSEFVSQRLRVEVIQLLLTQHIAQLNGQFRLIWKNLLGGGYQAIVLSSSHSIEPQDLSSIAALADSSMVEQAKRNLLQNWQRAMAEPDLQVAAMELIVLHSLPLDIFQQYQQMLTALDNNQLLATIRASLDPTQQFSLRITPINEDS